MKLESGMLVKTSYSDNQYRIIDIHRGCTCPSYVDTLNLRDKAPRSPEHIHLTCSYPHSNQEQFYIGRFSEDTLRSIDKTYCGMKQQPDYDYLIVLPGDKFVQMSLL